MIKEPFIYHFMYLQKNLYQIRKTKEYIESIHPYIVKCR